MRLIHILSLCGGSADGAQRAVGGAQLRSGARPLSVTRRGAQ